MKKQPVHIGLQSRLNRRRRYRIARTNARKAGHGAAHPSRGCAHCRAPPRTQVNSPVDLPDSGATLFGVRRIPEPAPKPPCATASTRMQKEPVAANSAGTRHPIRRTEIVHLRLHTVQRNLRAQPRLIRTKNRTVRGRNHQARVSLNSRTQQAHLRHAHDTSRGRPAPRWAPSWRRQAPPNRQGCSEEHAHARW